MVILLLDVIKHPFGRMDGHSADKAESFREDLVLLDMTVCPSGERIVEMIEKSLHYCVAKDQRDVEITAVSSGIV
jgi:hypothetical protein